MAGLKIVGTPNHVIYVHGITAGYNHFPDSRFPFPFDVLLYLAFSVELAVVCCHWRRVVLDPRVALRTEVNIELVSSLALSFTVIVVSVLIIT